MHKSEWRDWGAAISSKVGGSDLRIAKFWRRGLASWRGRGVQTRRGWPWEAEGISRSAWYRRRKSVGYAVTSSLPMRTFNDGLSRGVFRQTYQV
jgi:hypothetical protein